MTEPIHDLSDRDFEPFFTSVEFIERNCLFLEAELAELSADLSTSRQKIATLVLMWTAATNELSLAVGELRETRDELAALRAPQDAPAG